MADMVAPGTGPEADQVGLLANFPIIIMKVKGSSFTSNGDSNIEFNPLI